MKIFIPGEKDPNPYLDEISRYSTHQFIYDDFRNFKKEYSVISIHWPEAIFSWRQPTNTDLEELENELKIWKKHSKIIYTRHDSKSHLGANSFTEKLFSLIIENADAIVHLGEYSNKDFQRKYPQKVNVTIPHPLYENSFKQVPLNVARKKLGISEKALVIIAPGKIRNKDEKQILLKTFKSLPFKNKVLISNNMLPFKLNLEFKGRVKLKRYFDINKFILARKIKKYQPPKYIFNYQFTDPDELSLMIAASNIVFIPRIDLLNSGNVFLGLTYRKIIVGPAIGNIKEHLLEHKLPTFDPNSIKSIYKSLIEGVNLLNKKDFIIKENLLKQYEPKKVAERWDTFLTNMVNE